MKKAWILTHFEAYEDRRVYGVFLTKEAGEAFITRWVEFCLKLKESLPELPDADAKTFLSVYDKRERAVDKAAFPGNVKVSQHSLCSCHHWLELDEVDILT